MGALESNTTNIYGVHLRESADDGSDFSNAAADYRVLFLGEDGFLHAKDSAGSVTDPYDISGGAGGNPVVYDIERYTAGDISVVTQTVGTVMPGVGSPVVAAVAGDLLMIGVNLRATTASTTCRIDVKCVTGATENFVSSLGTTAATFGISGWFIATADPISGEVPYVVQAADISGGNVTLDLCAWRGAAATLTIAANTNDPLLFWVRNLGQ
jgi:hypothetical protein